MADKVHYTKVSCEDCPFRKNQATCEVALAIARAEDASEVNALRRECVTVSNAAGQTVTLGQLVADAYAR